MSLLNLINTLKNIPQEPSQEIHLLTNASAEIKRLRRTNELQSARLNMFDSVMLLLDSKLAHGGMAHSPDIVSEIDKFIQEDGQPKATPKNE